MPAPESPTSTSLNELRREEGRAALGVEAEQKAAKAGGGGRGKGGARTSRCARRGVVECWGGIVGMRCQKNAVPCMCESRAEC